MKNDEKKASFQESSPRTGMQLAAARVRERLLIEQKLPGFRRQRRKKKACEIVNHPKPWDTRSTISRSLDEIQRPCRIDNSRLPTKLCQR